LNDIEQRYFQQQTTGKTGSRHKRVFDDKYYQIAKPDEFLFTMKF